MKKLLLSIGLAVALVAPVEAYTVIGVLPSFQVPDYASWNSTNNAFQQGTNTSLTLATNGYFPVSISGVGSAGIVTNAILINAGQTTGNNCLIQTVVNAAGAAPGGLSSACTNAVFNFYVTQGNVSLTTNIVNGSTVFTNTSYTYYGSITNPITTTNLFQGTNCIWSPYTTPPYNSMMKLWLYSVQVNCTNSIYITNYSVSQNAN